MLKTKKVRRVLADDVCTLESHSLYDSRLAYWSRDGTMAYALCPCKRSRCVTRQDWAQAHPEEDTQP